MPHSGTGERVTPVLDFPSRDGLSVQAVRVDYEPGGFTRGTHRHPAGAYVYVIDGSVDVRVGDANRRVEGRRRRSTSRRARCTRCRATPARTCRRA